jgi:hypothetical protein
VLGRGKLQFAVCACAYDLCAHRNWDMVNYTAVEGSMQYNGTEDMFDAFCDFLDSC